MATTTNVERIGESTRTMVRSSQESAQIVTDYFVRAQELNIRFAQRAVETWIDGFRRQTELSQDVAQELFERATEQTEIFQGLFGQWSTNVFTGFPITGVVSAATPSEWNGLRLVETAARNARATAERSVEAVTEAAIDANGGLPIEKYDELNVGEISERLGSLSIEELEQVRRYEQTTKNRGTLLQEIERKINFPIEGYDEMNVAQISEQLDGLSTDELTSVRDYEKRNKGRDTLIEQIERKITAASA